MPSVFVLYRIVCTIYLCVFSCCVQASQSQSYQTTMHRKSRRTTHKIKTEKKNRRTNEDFNIYCFSVACCISFWCCWRGMQSRFICVMCICGLGLSVSGSMYSTYIFVLLPSPSLVGKFFLHYCFVRNDI